MIPKAHSRGHSFHGITQYLLNDTDHMQPDAERVAWTDTVNMLTDDIEKAAKVMAWTDTHSDHLKKEAGQSLAGKKQEAGNVYHFTIAWAQGDTPDKDHCTEEVAKIMEKLNLSEHEYYTVAHSDREHFHLHIVANMVHPTRGTVAEIGTDHRKLQRWASDYEREHGIHCQVREDNRGQGRKDREQKRDYATALERAFIASDNGQSFIAALEYEGLTLTQQKNNSKLYIVDEHGNIDAMTRNLKIEGKDKSGKIAPLARSAKSKAIADKLADIDLKSLPYNYDIAKQIKAEIANTREAQDGDQQAKMLDAAEAHAKKVAAVLNKLDAEEKAANKRVDAEFVPQLQKVEVRQLQEVKELETRLQANIIPQLQEVSSEADRMQAVVEGRGFKLALRRVWRGKKDRVLLDDIRSQKTEIGARILKAREDLKEIHLTEHRQLADLQFERKKAIKTKMDKARSKVKFERAGRGVSFKDLSPERQIETLKDIKKSNRGLASKDGARVSLDHARAERDKRLNRRIWDIKEAKKLRAKDAATQRKMIAQRPEAEARAAEIAAQSDSGDAKKSRIESRVDDIKKSEGRKDKGRDFTP